MRDAFAVWKIERIQFKLSVRCIGQDQGHAVEAHDLADAGRNRLEDLSQLKIGNDAVVQVEDELQLLPLALQLSLHGFRMGEVQTIVNCQRDVISDEGQKADFVPGEGVLGLPRKTKRPQSTDRRMQRKDTKGLVSAFTEKLNRRIEPDLPVEGGNDERMRLLRDHLRDLILPRFPLGLWDDCKSFIIKYVSRKSNLLRKNQGSRIGDHKIGKLGRQGTYQLFRVRMCIHRMHKTHKFFDLLVRQAIIGQRDLLGLRAHDRLINV